MERAKYPPREQIRSRADSRGIAAHSWNCRSSVACAFHDTGHSVLAEPRFPADQAITAPCGGQCQHLGCQPSRFRPLSGLPAKFLAMGLGREGRVESLRATGRVRTWRCRPARSPSSAKRCSTGRRSSSFRGKFAIAHFRAKGEAVSDEMLAHTSPVCWEHIGLSGDFLWERAASARIGRRPLNLGHQCRVA